MPIFVARNAARHLKCDEDVAMFCAMALVTPTFVAIVNQIASGTPITLFGINLPQTSYTSTVIPPIVMTWALSYVERFFKKYLPEVMRQMFTPLFCSIIIVPLTLLVIGPLSQTLANGIARGMQIMSVHVPYITAFIFGAVWQCLVVFGVHWGFTPIMLANFANDGSDFLQLWAACAVIGQTGAALAVAIKTKDVERKRMGYSGALTGLFGITEPIIYGVNLPLKRPFVCGCAAGAIASVITCFFHSRYYVYAGMAGPLTMINALGDGDYTSLIGALVASVAAFALAFIFVWFAGTGENAGSAERATKAKAA